MQAPFIAVSMDSMDAVPRSPEGFFVDIAGKKTIGEIPTGAGAEGIAFRPNDTELWVTNRDANTISIIDPVKLANAYAGFLAGA